MIYRRLSIAAQICAILICRDQTKEVVSNARIWSTATITTIQYDFLNFIFTLAVV